MTGLFAHHGIAVRAIDAVVLGSVVPPLTPIMCGMVTRYFGRVLSRDAIQEEVIVATREFRHRATSNANQTQLEFVKLCETRLVRKARELEIAL